jgi:hypothetical protein
MHYAAPDTLRHIVAKSTEKWGPSSRPLTHSFTTSLAHLLQEPSKNLTRRPTGAWVLCKFYLFVPTSVEMWDTFYPK